MLCITSKQRQFFRQALRCQRERARILCKDSGCHAVYYCYADYLKNNLVKEYDLFLRPLSMEQLRVLEIETVSKYPNRALFVVWRDCDEKHD